MPSPRAGEDTNWEKLAQEQTARKVEFEDMVEWLQDQWLDPDVKAGVDAYEENVWAVSRSGHRVNP